MLITNLLFCVATLPQPLLGPLPCCSNALLNYEMETSTTWANVYIAIHLRNRLEEQENLSRRKRAAEDLLWREDCGSPVDLWALVKDEWDECEMGPYQEGGNKESAPRSQPWWGKGETGVQGGGAGGFGKGQVWRMTANSKRLRCMEMVPEARQSEGRPQDWREEDPWVGIV